MIDLHVSIAFIEDEIKDIKNHKDDKNFLLSQFLKTKGSIDRLEVITDHMRFEFSVTESNEMNKYKRAYEKKLEVIYDLLRG